MRALVLDLIILLGGQKYGSGGETSPLGFMGKAPVRGPGMKSPKSWSILRSAKH